MDIGRSAEGCRRPLSAAFLGTLTTNFAHARREWYAQEVNLTLRCAPNQGGIDSVRLDSLLQSDLHGYSIVSVITLAVRARSWWLEFREILLKAAVYNLRQSVRYP